MFWRVKYQFALVVLAFFCSSTLFGATIGTVVPVVGQARDMVHDPSRNVVYVANPTRNDVEVFSLDGKPVAAIPTGLAPGSLALSADGNTLYVANSGSLTISAINLRTQQPTQDYGVSQRPDAIAIGRDGLILILGTVGLQRLDPGTGRITTVPISSPLSTPAGTPNIPPTILPNFVAGLVTTSSGNLIIGQSSNRLFVYEVASGTVLRSRNVTGLLTILSAAPDGSRFMAGPFLFDTQTLAILGRAGTLNAALTGGSAFSADGNTVYGTFSTQNPINPLNPSSTTTTTTSVLQVMRASSLTPTIGLRLPEAITSKIVSSADGQFLFASSMSGFTIIPIGNLGSLPLLDVSSTNIILSVDPCNRTIASATVQIRNNGGGRMTFAATVNNTTPPLLIALSQRTGVAPATLTISLSFSPQPAPNFATSQYVVTLSSPEAVNVEPAILVNANYRDVSQRGTVVPITGVGVDMQTDSARQRLYIANYTQDQIEVFSLTSQTFLPPIRVGNRPLSMAIANSNTMVVANSGAENLSVVDLDAMQEVDQIQMGPLPVNATPFFPHSIAASSNAILFTAVPLPTTPGIPPGNGFVWQLSLLTHSAFPRINLGAGVPNMIQGRNAVVAAGDGSGIMLVGGTAGGPANILLYDPIADTFPISRPTVITTGFRGTVSAAADGSYYVVDNMVFNSVLASQATLAPAPGIGPPLPGNNAFGVTAGGTNSVVRVQGAPAPNSTVQTLQRFNLMISAPDLQVQMPEPVMDITTNVTPTRQWPPLRIAQELGVTGQTQLLARGMAMDSSSNVYALTLSGLSIVALATNTNRAPSFSANGVVNSPSKTGPLAAGGLISILGSNLADVATAGSTPLPQTLGGVCVTANEVTLPLFSTSPTQIDAQLPQNFPTGNITLTVRSTKLGLSSAGVQVRVNAAGPSLYSIPLNGQLRASLFHTIDGAMVTPDYPADRDETLVLYASGLGPVTPNVPAGQPAALNPLSATTQSIGVTIGGRPYPVLASYLAPDFVGLYAIIIYVPGDRAEGNDLRVVVSAGGVSSAAENAPLAAIQ